MNGLHLARAAEALELRIKRDLNTLSQPDISAFKRAAIESVIAEDRAAIKTLHDLIDGDWISVETELPDEGCTVLVATDTDGNVDVAYRDGGRWFWCSGRHDEPIDETVTHWRDVPEHPTQPEVAR